MSLVSRVKALEDEFIAYRRHLHANPEVGFEEVETSKFIETILTKYGIECRRNGDTTGVIATIKGEKAGGKVVALRADIDALKQAEKTGLEFSSKNPGVSHSCGHDLHTATLLGAARLINEYKSELCGTVRFLFQPAEETLGGSISMIANGALENPKVDYLLAAHTWPDMPAGSIGVRKGPALASADHFTLTVKGKSGHAAHPHRCIDPIVIGAHIITQMQTIVSRQVAPIDSAVVSIGHLTAGILSNIIPDEAVMEGTVRTLEHSTREMIRKSLERMVIHTAEGMGGSAALVYDRGVPPTINDAFIIDKVSEAVAALLGADKLLPVPTPSMGAEDLAFYLEQVPGALIRLGTADERPETKGALHNPQTLFNEQAIPTGVIAMVGSAFALTGSDMSVLR